MYIIAATFFKWAAAGLGAIAILGLLLLITGLANSHDVGSEIDEEDDR